MKQREKKETKEVRADGREKKKGEKRRKRQQPRYEIR